MSRTDAKKSESRGGFTWLAKTGLRVGADVKGDDDIEDKVVLTVATVFPANAAPVRSHDGC